MQIVLLAEGRVTKLRKRYLLAAAGLGAVVGYVLMDEENRRNLMEKINPLLNDANNYSKIEDVGMPDQIESSKLEQLEKAKMVSEGSQYGVQYYNEVKEEEIQ